MVIRGRGQLSICYARTGRIGRAKEIYAALRKKKSPRTLLVPLTQQLAEAANEAGNVPWSSDLFGWLQDGAETPDDRLKARFGLGWSQFKAGKLDEAAETLDRLLRQKPPSEIAAEAALARGRILEKLGRLRSRFGHV